MNNKYMFVCPNCKQTYSSDKRIAQKCPVCGKQLLLMDISVEEWRRIDEQSKELCKDKAIHQATINQNENTLDITIRAISYGVLHFALAGLIIGVYRTEELPYAFLTMVIFFALYWWKKPSLEEWKENCISRKRIYWGFGLLFGVIALQTKVNSTATFGSYTYTINRTGDKAYYFFISALLICKGLCSIKFENTKKEKENIYKSSLEQQQTNETVTENTKTVNSFSKESSSLLSLNSKMFPENCQDHIKRQMKYIIGDSLEENEYLKIYVYCMTHYIVNGKNYSYITKMLPVAFPQLKDEKTIKTIATYTLMCSSGKPDKINLLHKNTYANLEKLSDELDKQEEIVALNSEKNKEEYDEMRGIVREKPMYFDGAKNAENYLNLLQDTEGNKLHIGGNRFTYSVDGIPEILDNYQLFKEDGTKYGDLYVSIYGKDNYQHVPKGYRHQILSKPNQEQNKQYNNTKNIKNISEEKEDEKKSINHAVEEKKEKITAENFTTYNDSKNKEATKNTQNNLSSTIMFCRKCGTKIELGTKYCRKCGTKIG